MKPKPHGKAKRPNIYLITWTDRLGIPQAEFSQSHDEVVTTVKALERDQATNIQVGPFHRTAQGILEEAA